MRAFEHVVIAGLAVIIGSAYTWVAYNESGNANLLHVGPTARAVVVTAAMLWVVWRNNERLRWRREHEPFGAYVWAGIGLAACLVFYSRLVSSVVLFWSSTEAGVKFANVVVGLHAGGGLLEWARRRRMRSA